MIFENFSTVLKINLIDEYAKQKIKMFCKADGFDEYNCSFGTCEIKTFNNTVNLSLFTKLKCMQDSSLTVLHPQRTFIFKFFF